MKMVTEDYVSFEVAKLLKEKGFECEKDSITAMYNELGKFHPLSTAVDEYYYDYNDFDEYDYVAPTLQMICKWLEHAHGYMVYSYPVYDGRKIEWMYNIWFDNSKMFLGQILEFGTDETFSTHQEACETAIKYCLENLI